MGQRNPKSVKVLVFLILKAFWILKNTLLKCKYLLKTIKPNLLSDNILQTVNILEGIGQREKEKLRLKREEEGHQNQFY